MNDVEKQQLGEIRVALRSSGWFVDPGAYVLVDGQYGSTGKGALAALFGMLFHENVNIVTTNAGPNSGHTGYYPNADGASRNKVLTQQIPVFAAVAYGMGAAPIAYLNAGAVIDPQILRKEAAEYGFGPNNLVVHLKAAMIDYDHKTDDAESTFRIASTNKGVGRAIARKVMRENNVADQRLQDLMPFAHVSERRWGWGYDYRDAAHRPAGDRVFVETAQGFSLGMNQRFYPYCTSRECTVGQAITDANIPYNKVKKVVMSLRTFPIRVGNTPQGDSGPCYPDQKETSWEELNLPPELTTVTKRIRRVFTWSDQQFCDAVEANQPNVLFLTFMDYLAPAAQREFVRKINERYQRVMRKLPEVVLVSDGPYPTNVRLPDEAWHKELAGLMSAGAP